MKRLAAGVGLAATIVAGGYLAETAGAQEAGICAPVFDETLGNADGASSLGVQIRKFDEHGVLVSLQVYGPGQFTEDGQLYDQVDKTYDKCGWDDSHINVAFADNPGRDNDFYDLAIGQEPGMFIDDDRIFDAESELSADLDDPTTSTQEDFARFLSRLYPYGGIDEQPAPNTTSPSNETADSPQEPIDIPVIPIVIAGIGIVSVTGISLRVLAGRKLSRLKRATNHATTEAKGKADKAIEGSDENLVDGAQDLIAIVHDDDASEVREALDALRAQLASLDEAQQAFDTDSQRKGFWPNTRQASSSADDVMGAAATADQLTQGLRTTVDAFNTQIATLETEGLPKSSAQIETTAERLNTLTAAGWQLPDIAEQISGLRQKHQQATEARGSGYISQPAALVASIIESVTAIQSQLDTLDGRHQGLVAAYKAQTTPMRQMPKLVTDTTAKLDSAIDTYGSDNFSDLNPRARLTELLANQRTAYRELQPLSTTLSLTALDEGEARIQQFDQAVAEITQLSAEVDTRIQQIERLARDLPDLYEELDEHLADVLEDLEEFGDKTTDETRIEIMSLKTQIEAGNQEAHASKPNLHELSARRETQRETLVAFAEKARAEAVEMGELWVDVQQIPEHAAAALKTLKTYASSYDDVSSATRDAIDNIRIEAMKPADTRAELREQVALAKDWQARVRDLKEQAEDEVDAAERRREARRIEKARQQADAEEAADRAEQRRRMPKPSLPSLPKIGGNGRTRNNPPSSPKRSSGGGRPKGGGSSSSNTSRRRSKRI